MNLIAKTDIDLIDLIPTFIENRKKDIVRLRTAIEINDFSTIAWINRDLRDVAIPYGFDGLDAISQQISDAKKNKNMLLKLITDLEYYVNNVRIEVKLS